MSLQGFWNDAAAGEIKFVWVHMSDGSVCPDCLAIAAQQPAEGQTWDEWQSFGFPGSGHTVCRFKCRCVMAPLPYIERAIETPPELEKYSRSKFIINVGGELKPQQVRILALSSAIEEAGVVLKSLRLRGLSLTDMEKVLLSEVERLKLAVDLSAISI